jgi:hypothetical protein
MGPGWWQASDGKWYPPRESDEAPEPGWWLAADGKWYPPADVTPPPEPEPEPAPAPTPAPTPAATAAPTPAPTPAATPTTAAPTSAPRNGSNGSTPTDASEQIRRRNQASRDDAVTQFPARFLAAARAVQVLESELALTGAEPAEHAPKKHERKGRARAEAMAAEAKAKAATKESAETTSSAPASAVGGLTDDPVGTFTTDTAPGEVEPPAPPPEPPPEPPTVPVGRPTTRPGEEQGWPAPRPAPAAHPSPRVAEPGGPLIELRPSPLGADLDHLGDRLLVFADRVELRDRGDHVRQTVAAADIADVGVQRKFTGAVLTIAGLDGVVKGLKPDQADEVARLVQTGLLHSTAPTNGEAPEAEAAHQAPAPEPRPEESALAAPSPDAVANAADRLAILNRSRLNEADLLRKLADLHRAGVLSDAEFSEKIALVGRLVSGETIVVV